MNERKLFRKTDLIVICIVAAVAALCFFLTRANSPADVCHVTYDGKIVKTVQLSGNTSFKIDEAPLMEFEIKDGMVAAIVSDCPDKICVRTGYIGRAGQKIVCLPNKVTVTVETVLAGADEPDMIAQ